MIFTQEAIKNADIKDLENFSIMPSLKKIAVINLGINKEDLIKIVDKKYSVSVFNYDFDIDYIKNNFDVVFISNGDIEGENFNILIEKIKKLIGKNIILGVGFGKKVIKKTMDIKYEGNYIDNELKVYGCEVKDDYMKKILKFI